MGLRFGSCLALVVVVSVPIAAEAQDHPVGITLSAGVLTGEDAVPAPNFTRPVYTARRAARVDPANTLRQESESSERSELVREALSVEVY